MKSVPGVKEQTAKKNAESFEVTGDFNDKEVTDALQKAGFTGKVAQLHGGMDYQEREEQVEFFRQPASAGGASYLLATDAAGEGINLQFCHVCVNYDLPWNPMRVEQRVGRVYRYGQQKVVQVYHLLIWTFLTCSVASQKAIVEMLLRSS